MPVCSSGLRTQAGGVIAIPANSDTWPFHYRRKAEEILARECPQGYEIELEEEYVTGQTTSTNVDEQNRSQQIAKHASLSVDSTHTTSTTANVTEWRIHYRKKSSENDSDNRKAEQAAPERAQPVDSAGSRE